MNTTHVAMTAHVEVWKKGFLYKRQRGRRSKDLQKLKFQKRFCQLTATAFEYYKDCKTTQLRGQFPLARVRIVEHVIPDQFHQKYSFQIGDNDEVMYLGAKSNEERKDWMQAFRTAASEKGNTMLTHYHPGVYGSPLKNQWSCCKNSDRTCQGCHSIHQSISKTWTFPQLSPRPKARKRPQSIEISPNNFPEEKVTAKKTTPTAHPLQSVPA